ncbi:MAG: hypothetical protein K0R75_3211 [Paenibacillaceae bacterium]|jgi:hypothetical protein|nr:hypothetical protein [Paenibacillaceae bacterium]
MPKDYHCCATCRHFEVVKSGGVSARCSRLGYETSPKYKFNCWDPISRVRELMMAENGDGIQASSE